MTRILQNAVLFGLCLIFLPAASSAQQSLSDVGFSGQFFFSYEHDVFEDSYSNEFTIKRGYITFRKDLSDQFEIRFTQDITIDQQGDGLGDIELRLKYALVKYSMDDFGIFTSPNIEAGVVHRPWINFEQDVNDYRAQKSMFLDQNNILSSADYGLQFASGLGPELDDDKQRGLGSNPGRYGSFAIGLYNGGGYSEPEFNNNKLLEASLSLRPFSERMPGLQASVLGAYGKGNIPESPDFNLLGSAFTYESEHINMVLLGFRGTGDGSGRFTDPVSFEAFKLEGWSIFTEFLPIDIPVSLTLRYDELYNRDHGHLAVQQGIGGIGYIFSNRSKILLNISRSTIDTEFDNTEFSRFEIVTEIRF